MTPRAEKSDPFAAAVTGCRRSARAAWRGRRYEVRLKRERWSNGTATTRREEVPEGEDSS